MTRNAIKKLPVRHIGNISAICNKNISNSGWSLREDLGYKRYKQLGIKERFRDEAPYRICERCLVIEKRRHGNY